MRIRDHRSRRRAGDQPGPADRRDPGADHLLRRHHDLRRALGAEAASCRSATGEPANDPTQGADRAGRTPKAATSSTTAKCCATTSNRSRPPSPKSPATTASARCCCAPTRARRTRPWSPRYDALGQLGFRRCRSPPHRRPREAGTKAGASDRNARRGRPTGACSASPGRTAAVLLVALLGMLIEAAAAGAFTQLMEPMVDETFVARNPKVEPVSAAGDRRPVHRARHRRLRRRHGMARAGRSVARDLRVQVLGKYLRLPGSRFDTEPVPSMLVAPGLRQRPGRAGRGRRAQGDAAAVAYRSSRCWA